MTRSEFIERYLARSGLSPVAGNDGVMIPPSAGHPGYIALPCDCGEDSCVGWAKVRNDPESIADHNQLYRNAPHDS